MVKSSEGDQGRAEKALKRLQARMSADDKKYGERLLEQQSEFDVDGLYVGPRLRYLQTMLNRLGASAGDEDGLPGPLTDAVLVSGLPGQRFFM